MIFSILPYQSPKEKGGKAPLPIGAPPYGDISIRSLSSSRAAFSLNSSSSRRRALAWDLLLDLRATPHGPYSVPWRTGLSWSPEGGPGETEAVREVLSRYHVRD